MAQQSDLEISLFHKGDDSYLVVARYQPAGEVVPRNIQSSTAQFDISELQQKRSNLVEYGTLLAKSLFSDEKIRLIFHDAVQDSRNGQPLHLRLFIDRQESDLDLLLWEAMRNPEDNYATWLTADPAIYFSRFLQSSDWGNIRLHPQDQMRALVVIANPSDLGEFEIALDANRTIKRRLAPIDVEGEVERVSTAMQGLGNRVHWLVNPKEATLDGLMEKLNSFHPIGVDIFYLACHGEFMTFPVPGPYLWLEDENGKAAAVRGETLVRRIASLPAEKRPRLIVLASCQSAGTGSPDQREDGSALVPIGPMLAAAGIPAVLSMQGKVTMETVKKFMPPFFEDLRQNGIVDRALALARGSVQDRSDSYMPVLFMRLPGGSMWQMGQRTGQAANFSKWNDLVASVKNAREKNTRKAICLPILGPGLVEGIVGTRNRAALELARLHSYPFKDQDRENFPQVTQFMTNYNSLQFTFDEYCSFLKRQLQQTDPDLFTGDLSGNDPAEMFANFGEKHREAERQNNEAKDLHSLLAKLNLPLYITANPDNLMAGALREQEILVDAQKVQVNPTEVVCNWRSVLQGGQPQSGEVPLPNWSQIEPVVFYLFGRLDDRDSMVMTQDNYYDFLINVNQEVWRIPQKIRTAMVESVLLFLGFPIDDWGMRTIFRLLANAPGFTRLRNHANIAVQIDPENAQIHDPERARKYFEEYFKSTHVDIYWGRTDEFILELDQRVNH